MSNLANHPRLPQLGISGPRPVRQWYIWVPLARLARLARVQTRILYEWWSDGGVAPSIHRGVFTAGIIQDTIVLYSE